MLARISARPRLVVLVAAVCIAAGAALHYLAEPPRPIMGTRAQGITDSLKVLDRGGPPLLGSAVPYRPGVPLSQLYPVGVTDDQGIYLYLPLLGETTGQHDPAVLMNWFSAGAFAILLLILPLIVHALTGSIPAAAVAPLLVMWQFNWARHQDLYWVQAWIMLLGLPGLVLAYRWWTSGRRPRATLLLVALGLAASFANSIRIEAGLPIMIGAMGIVALAGTDRWRRPHTWRLGVPGPDLLQRVGAALLVLVAYYSVSTFAFAAVRAYRDSVIGAPATWSSQYPSQHPTWHNAYIGFGYLPNPYGIIWNDAVSTDAVLRVRPGTPYLSATYESIARHLWLKMVREHPGFALRTFWMKVRVVFAQALHRFWLALPLVVLVLLTRRTRDRVVALMLAIPALATGVLAPVLTMPSPSYTLGWLGTWGAVWLLFLLWLLSDLVAVVARIVRGGVRRVRPPHRARSLRVAAVVAAVAIVAATLNAKAEPAPPPSSDALYAAQASALLDPALSQRPTVASWRFDGALPRGWTAAPGAALQRDFYGTSRRGLHVTTTAEPGAVQLEGPPVMLPPGSYALVGDAYVFAGGVELEVKRGGSVLAVGRYSWQQAGGIGQPVGAQFTLNRRSPVRVSLSNWTSIRAASAWTVWRLGIVRTGPPPEVERRSSRRGSVWQTIARWSFSGHLPEGWSSALPGTQLRPDGNGYLLRTTADRFAYQLLGPERTLAPGTYRIELVGEVKAGGLDLGVLDVDKDTWIAQTVHASRSGRPMVTRFTLHRPTKIQPILANWRPTAGVSIWKINAALLATVAS